MFRFEFIPTEEDKKTGHNHVIIEGGKSTYTVGEVTGMFVQFLQAMTYFVAIEDFTFKDKPIETVYDNPDGN